MFEIPDFSSSKPIEGISDSENALLKAQFPSFDKPEINKSVIEFFNALKNHIQNLINSTESKYKQMIRLNQLELLENFTSINNLEELLNESKDGVSELKAQVERIQWHLKVPKKQLQDHIRTVSNLKQTLEIVRSFSKFIVLVQKLDQKIPLDIDHPDHPLRDILSIDSIESNLINTDDLNLLLTYSASLVQKINSLMADSNIQKINFTKYLFSNNVLPKQAIIETLANNLIEKGLSLRKITFIDIGFNVFLNLKLLSSKTSNLIDKIIKDTVLYIEKDSETISAVLSDHFSSSQLTGSSRIDHRTTVSDVIWTVLRRTSTTISENIQKLNLVEKVIRSSKFSEEVYDHSFLLNYNSKSTDPDKLISLEKESHFTFLSWKIIVDSLETELYNTKSIFHINYWKSLILFQSSRNIPSSLEFVFRYLSAVLPFNERLNQEFFWRIC
ncbi:hypothetical protein BB560_004495 [Smittium megazygosporum]|uniref:Conserved oligomeric Golgi complex subunit 5 N-terminal domain-containing protein n=1 Tax=Smittium megazygosporum TaxID=133381 RepID=A0A2T9Z944_9FUNG|nr:hypothetical protein BB560_004495 [Smittium megazygosporum]